MITDVHACCQSAAAAMLASCACTAVLARTHPDKSKQCGSVDVVPGKEAPSWGWSKTHDLMQVLCGDLSGSAGQAGS